MHTFVHKQQFINRSAPTHFNNPSPRGRQQMGCIDYWHCSYINMKSAQLEASDLCGITPSGGSKWREERLSLPCRSTTNAITAEPSDLCVRVCAFYLTLIHTPTSLFHQALSFDSSRDTAHVPGEANLFLFLIAHFFVYFLQLHLEQDSNWNTHAHTG